MRRFQGPGGEVRLGRTTGGVAVVEGADDTALAFGLGIAHAEDRLVQMELVRLACRGKLSECLAATEESETIDVFMRRLGVARYSDEEARDLSPATSAWLGAYCRGVNRVLRRSIRPLEFLLVGHTPEPWTPADCLATTRAMSYVGLAEGQGDAERWIVEVLRRGADPAVLKRLFAPHLDGLDDAILGAIRELVQVEPFVPAAIRTAALPRLRASNNWVVAGSRTRSGKPLQANDPHLEGNRLPAIWYEVVLRTTDDYRVGITMPGLPGIGMGRNSRVSAGFTYGFMDLIDHFVEDCADGKYREGKRWRPFERRTEEIRRKGKPARVIEIFENPRGVLDGTPFKKGLHLLTAWSSRRRGAARTVEALRRFQRVRSVAEAQEVLREVGISCNWLIADVDGAIGLQQSGHLPARRHSGLHPVPGWDPAFHWEGDADPATLRSERDPGCGFLVTANEHQATEDGPLSVNMHMGKDRAGRIADLLEGREDLTAEDMRAIQADLHSRQARRYMEVLRPLLPDTPAGRALDGWDLTYRTDAREPVLFEAVWRALLRETFGPFFGPEVWEYTAAETSILVDFFHYFDDAFLGGDPAWFRGTTRKELCRRVLAEVLPAVPPGTWGDVNRFAMTNVFFGGKLPGWMGFDVGPVAVPGNRATPCQGQVFRSHGRATSFVPSWRYVTDLAEDRAFTSLAGGPSGRRFSRWYAADVARWLGFEVKELSGR